MLKKSFKFNKDVSLSMTTQPIASNLHPSSSFVNKYLKNYKIMDQ